MWHMDRAKRVVGSAEDGNMAPGATDRDKEKAKGLQLHLFARGTRTQAKSITSSCL